MAGFRANKGQKSVYGSIFRVFISGAHDDAFLKDKSDKMAAYTASEKLAQDSFQKLSIGYFSGLSDAKYYLISLRQNVR